MPTVKNSKPKNIGVVAGGYSGEYDISISSAQTICSHLDETKYDVYKIIIDRNKWMHEASGVEINKNDFTLSLDGRTIKFDLVFIGIHGTETSAVVSGKLVESYISPTSTTASTTNLQSPIAASSAVIIDDESLINIAGDARRSANADGGIITAEGENSATTKHMGCFEATADTIGFFDI